MTVKELIEALQQYPGDMRVVTPGFDEGGIGDIAVSGVIKVVFHDDQDKHPCGQHEEIEDYWQDYAPDKYKEAMKKATDALKLNF